MYVYHKLLQNEVFYASGFCYNPDLEPMVRESQKMILRADTSHSFEDAVKIRVHVSHPTAISNLKNEYKILLLGRCVFR